MRSPYVAVVIPWREQESRVWAYNVVTQLYRAYLPHAKIISTDTDDDLFNLAACRNKGVLLAQEAGADVVVIADADTIPEKDALEAAIAMAIAEPGVVTPYTQYRSLMERGTNEFKTGTRLQDCSHLRIAGACSGVYVTTPATWWSHGGQDERFRGWGAEDSSWESAHKVLLGKPRTVQGRVYSLHHESQVKEGEQFNYNFALCYAYLGAEKAGPATMRELIGQWWQNSPYAPLNTDLVAPE